MTIFQFTAQATADLLDTTPPPTTAHRPLTTDPRPTAHRPLPTRPLHQILPYHRISLDIVAIAAGSSGNITGESLVRVVLSPIRLTIAFTGQPHAL